MSTTTTEKKDECVELKNIKTYYCVVNLYNYTKLKDCIENLDYAGF